MNSKSKYDDQEGKGDDGEDVPPTKVQVTMKKKRFWSVKDKVAVVKEFQSSNAVQADFCAVKGIGDPGTLWKWIRKLDEFRIVEQGKTKKLRTNVNQLLKVKLAVTRSGK